MSEALNRAVFLSYASQDAEAAHRICSALRAAGVEVWFDQSELRGGDAWDAKIRTQIKECALFVPIISANTQARPEGYFRREWRLAVERMHDLADDHPFLLPIVIDDTSDVGARVPERFRERQWSRLRGGEVSPEFCERVKTLLAGERGGPEQRPTNPTAKSVAARGTASKRRRVLLTTAGLAVLVSASLFVVLINPRGSESGGALGRKTIGSADPMSDSDARRRVAKARQLFEGPEVTNRENFLLAQQLCDRAVELAPEDAEVWAARAQLSYLMRTYGHDRTPARLRQLISDAQRGRALAPESYEARLGEAYALALQPDRTREAESIYRSLLTERPNDRRVLRNLGHAVRWLGRVEEAFPFYDQAAALPGGDPIALADKANVYCFLNRLPEAEKAVEQSLAQAPTGRAFLIRTLLHLILHGDTERALASLKQVPAATLRENRGVNVATWVWLWRREPERALDFLRTVPQELIDDLYFTGPKSVLTGWAHQLAGHHEAARADWENALAMLESGASDQARARRVMRCELLARQGRREEANRLYAQIAQTEGAAWQRAELDALHLLIVLGRNDEALELLPEIIKENRVAYLVTAPALRLNPRYDSLRGDARFQALLAETKRVASGDAADAGHVQPNNVVSEQKAAKK
jgi:tetratricopeptide (TPR) repeat protein